MRRPVVFLPVALVAFAMACFADAPPISDEVILDHGFRYVDRSVEDLGEKRCAVAIADSSVLIAFRLDGVLGYRRLLQGEEVDINAKSLVDGSFRGSFDLSPFDGYGWKMVYLSDGSYGGCRSLWIRNLDRETLESTMGDVQIVASWDAIVQTPVIAPANDHHVVAWAEVSDSGR